MAQKSDNLNFIAALALYQHRRDNALGLTHVTQAQRGLIWYYNTRQKELLSTLTRAAIVQGAMSSIDRRMAEIMTEVEQVPIERKRELLTEAIGLKKQAQRIMKSGG